MTTTLKDASIGATFNSTSGINSSMNFFSGYIDEVSVWNRVLSQTEINAKMNTPITNPSNELKLNGYWNMNEIYGNMIYDKSGNNNTGYLKPDSANLYQDLPLFGPNVTCNGYSYTWSTGDTTPTKTIIPTTTGTTSYYVTVCNGTDTLVDLFKVIVTKCYKKLDDSEDIIYSKEKNGDFNLVAYPNPFNDDVNISYQLPKATNVNISVYNILGNKIATINNAMQDAGNYSIKCDFFKTMGVYLLRFQTDDRIENIRLIKNN
ncbi:MAG: hypothetical protein A2X12_08020 [Bacteroidetes bacterium GWE2_29_8]|nr:MAG: hypothetical protein A2X12_08020 [Bacteroidetes bacterium GWE2_29_8]OFY22052.1 MAG: hypothetical protein A2X02_04390 [Bacteroidetes bacterium GWF2_29_10]